jgi:hypothetical protein
LKLLPNSISSAKREIKEIAPNEFHCPDASIETAIPDRSCPRRGFLQTAAGGTLAGLLTAAGMWSAPPQILLKLRARLARPPRFRN